MECAHRWGEPSPTLLGEIMQWCKTCGAHRELVIVEDLRLGDLEEDGIEDIGYRLVAREPE